MGPPGISALVNLASRAAAALTERVRGSAQWEHVIAQNGTRAPTTRGAPVKDSIAIPACAPCAGLNSSTIAKPFSLDVSTRVTNQLPAWTVKMRRPSRHVCHVNQSNKYSCEMMRPSVSKLPDIPLKTPNPLAWDQRAARRRSEMLWCAP